MAFITSCQFSQINLSNTIRQWNSQWPCKERKPNHIQGNKKRNPRHNTIIQSTLQTTHSTTPLYMSRCLRVKAQYIHIYLLSLPFTSPDTCIALGDIPMNTRG